MEEIRRVGHWYRTKKQIAERAVSESELLGESWEERGSKALRHEILHFVKEDIKGLPYQMQFSEVLEHEQITLLALES
jgi:hypothetical protein